MAFPDESLTARERATLTLVTQLRADGDTASLIASLREDHDGPERVRDVLALLAELDPELIVQVALDALIQAHADDPLGARQTRRIRRDST
ncbi:MAG TPA: hypothetical protein VF257_01485 [Solirubrobacteraceae bacterium]